MKSIIHSLNREILWLYLKRLLLYFGISSVTIILPYFLLIRFVYSLLFNKSLNVLIVLLQYTLSSVINTNEVINEKHYIVIPAFYKRYYSVFQYYLIWLIVVLPLISMDIKNDRFGISYIMVNIISYFIYFNSKYQISVLKPIPSNLFYESINYVKESIKLSIKLSIKISISLIAINFIAINITNFVYKEEVIIPQLSIQQIFILSLLNIFINLSSYIIIKTIISYPINFNKLLYKRLDVLSNYGDTVIVSILSNKTLNKYNQSHRISELSNDIFKLNNKLCDDLTNPLWKQFLHIQSDYIDKQINNIRLVGRYGVLVVPIFSELELSNDLHVYSLALYDFNRLVRGNKQRMFNIIQSNKIFEVMHLLIGFLDSINLQVQLVNSFMEEELVSFYKNRMEYIKTPVLTPLDRNSSNYTADNLIRTNRLFRENKTWIGYIVKQILKLRILSFTSLERLLLRLLFIKPIDAVFSDHVIVDCINIIDTVVLYMISLLTNPVFGINNTNSRINTNNYVLQYLPVLLTTLLSIDNSINFYGKVLKKAINYWNKKQINKIQSINLLKLSNHINININKLIVYGYDMIVLYQLSYDCQINLNNRLHQNKK